MIKLEKFDARLRPAIDAGKIKVGLVTGFNQDTYIPAKILDWNCGGNYPIIVIQDDEKQPHCDPFRVSLDGRPLNPERPFLGAFVEVPNRTDFEKELIKFALHAKDWKTHNIPVEKQAAEASGKLLTTAEKELVKLGYKVSKPWEENGDNDFKFPGLEKMREMLAGLAEVMEMDPNAKYNGWTATELGKLLRKLSKAPVKPRNEMGWSNNDQHMRESCIDSITEIQEHHVPNPQTENEQRIFDAYQREIDWLNNLMPCSSWRPTEEQMSALANAAKHFGGCDPDDWEPNLEALYNHLNKTYYGR